jgi:mono/diheme cytochrome c family protein
MRPLAISQLVLSAAVLLGQASVARADTVHKGDEVNGATLFRVQCAACHGVDGRGGGDLASKLPKSVGNVRDPALLATNSNDDLKNVIIKGIPAATPPMLMPGSPWLNGLEIEDILTYLRHGALNVTDFFPTAQYFIAKTYTMDAKAQARVQQYSGQSVPAGQSTISVVTFYGEGNPKGPEFVPQDPVQLDKLSPKDRKGYLVFVDLPEGKSHATVGIAMSRDGNIKAIHSEPGLTNPSVDKMYQGYVGQGLKHDAEPLHVKGKGAASASEEKALNLAYGRAIEGVQAADADEKDRHWADQN